MNAVEVHWQEWARNPGRMQQNVVHARVILAERGSMMNGQLRSTKEHDSGSRM